MELYFISLQRSIFKGQNQKQLLSLPLLNLADQAHIPIHVHNVLMKNENYRIE